jgi:hypothetical protein
MKNNIFMSSKLMVVLSFLGLYLLSAGASLAVFTLLGGDSSSTLVVNSDELEAARSKLNADLPKTEVCPINGAKFTKVEKSIWEKRRPALVMVENSTDARPQSGLSKADIVYEAVAEGGITRFMGVYYCGAAGSAVKVAPIRSSRIYFVDLAAGYGTNPIYLHQGAANRLCGDCPSGLKSTAQVAPKVDAYTALDKLGWRNGRSGNDLDGGFNVGYPVIVRDQNRLSSTPAAWEHSVVASLDAMYAEADKRGFAFKDAEGDAWNKNFDEWNFIDGKANSSGSARNISFDFWSRYGDYSVEWNYDSASNLYKRNNGGKAHTDWEFDKPQITAANVVIMFVDEEGPVDSEKHMYYDVIGSGDALIFQNGDVVRGTWKKPNQVDREKFYDNNGDEVELVRGPIWIELVPDGNDVEY